MRVLSIIHYPNFGGPMNRNAMLAPLLGQQGIDVELLLPDEPGTAVPRLRGMGVNVCTMPLSRFRATRDPRVNLQVASAVRCDVRRLRSVLRTGEFDAVLLNGLHNPQGAIAASLEGVPVVWQLLDTFGPSAVRWGLMPVVVGLADVVMSTGMSVARLHPGARYLGKRLVLFFPPVDTERFKPDGQRRVAARLELGLDPDDVVIGAVANLNPMKGHRWLIRGIAALRERGIPSRAVILGASYPWRSEYERSLWAEASALGLRLGEDLIVRDPGSRVAELAPAFDVFWMTSEPRSEGVPTTVGEAMALGLPVVASDVGATREAVIDGQTGYIVPPCRPDAFAASTHHILTNNGLRARLQRNGRDHALKAFGIDVCAARHVAAIRTAVTRKSS
jgi:glycosyltransferase involved in cell wall biosynthesis